jgi:hypothetical protein
MLSKSYFVATGTVCLLAAGSVAMAANGNPVNDTPLHVAAGTDRGMERERPAEPGRRPANRAAAWRRHAVVLQGTTKNSPMVYVGWAKPTVSAANRIDRVGCAHPTPIFRGSLKD